MSLPAKALEVNDFTGGITDFYLAADVRKAQEMHNVLIKENKRIASFPGSEIYDETAAQIGVGAQRIGALFLLQNTIFLQSARRVYFYEPGSLTELSGPTGNQAFPSGNTSNFISYTRWKDHIFATSDAFESPIKIYIDDNGDPQVRTAGMPSLATAPTITPFGAGAANYIYGFAHAYEYAVGDTTYLDIGPIREVTKTSSSAVSGGAPTAISAIPVLSNGTTLNYDTTNVKIQIYRTENNGTTFYYVGEVTNGTTTFSDTVADSTLINQPTLYTTGGVEENDPPPKASLAHATSEFVYWAHVKEGTDIFKNRIYQSHAQDGDSVPARFFTEVDDEIVAVSSAADRVVLLCKNSVYRLDGSFDSSGAGFMRGIRISSTIGCVSHLAAVQANDLVFFAGQDGFYYTDGISVKPLSVELPERYADIVSSDSKKKKIYGAYDQIKKRVWWACQKESNVDNEFFFVLDLRWGLTPQSCFTTGGSSDFLYATAICFQNGNLLRADNNGYLFKHSDNITTNPRVDTGLAASLWKKSTIIYNYISSAMDFGNNHIRKWVTRMSILFENLGNLSTQINSINDDGRSTKPLKEIRIRSAIAWGDEDVLWGDPEIIWNYGGIFHHKRMMPAGQLRCSLKQIQITNSYTIITNSDTLGTVTVDDFAKTALLDNAPLSSWPTQSLDYYISFADDNYTRQFLIEDMSTDTLTFADPTDQCPTGVQEWLLKGYRKGEQIGIIAYDIQYALLGQTQIPFQGNSGENV